jgi:hypothetical protein
MTCVEVAPIEAVHVLHAPTEIRLRELNEEVHVVGHQAVRKAPPLAMKHDAAENRQVMPAIEGIAKDQLAINPTRIDVVDPARLFASQRSRHTQLRATARTFAPSEDKDLSHLLIGV